MSQWRQQAIEGLAAGTEFELSRTIDAADVEAFGTITRDYNPVHYDQSFAATKGFPELICHGLLVGSMVCEVGGQIGWLASGIDFRFLRPVYIGDTVTCKVTIDTIDEKNRAHATAIWTNSSGDIVLRASMSGQLPGDHERQILTKMLEDGDPTNKIRSARG
jgi:acyl dehydratase